ncbi:hypothetical protein PAPYR_13426 [Paratrimastix pyriformis]|uniref:Uncharacterized protein n=1 Tax=Paratrimastix pyriformis TaxID=342808 RepID=A0ABQ8U4E4_9EUKA|nr:hypothetical protein PAPYR_13426 [Paratrimastix pyriformis]
MSQPPRLVQPFCCMFCRHPFMKRSLQTKSWHAFRCCGAMECCQNCIAHPCPICNCATQWKPAPELEDQADLKTLVVCTNTGPHLNCPYFHPIGGKRPLGYFGSDTEARDFLTAPTPTPLVSIVIASGQSPGPYPAKPVRAPPLPKKPEEPRHIFPPEHAQQLRALIGAASVVIYTPRYHSIYTARPQGKNTDHPKVPAVRPADFERLLPDGGPVLTQAGHDVLTGALPSIVQAVRLPGHGIDPHLRRAAEGLCL